jgi:tetratricopeptide (TPR) repeat protein
LGAVFIHTNRPAQGIAECERALTLDRNLGMAHGYIGFAKSFMGRGEETEAHIQEALRLSPRDAYANVWLFWLAEAKLQLGADEEVITSLRRAIEVNRNFPFLHFYLAGALAQLGRVEDARAVAQIAHSLDPTFTINRFRAAMPSDNHRYLAGRDRIIEGMRKAGVAEA